MSIFSGLIGDLEKGVETILGLNPGAAPAGDAAKADIVQAATDAEKAIDPVVDELVNLALSRIPVLGSVIEGPVDSFVNGVVNGLVAKFNAGLLSKIAPASASPAA